MNNLRIPLDFSNIVEGRSLGASSQCNLEESIAQHLMIIATSKRGELFGRANFGSDIWDLEFNQLVKINEWESQVKESLSESFTLYEKRLKNIVVYVRLSEMDNDTEALDAYVRRKAEIKVTATIKEKDTPFNFATLFYISPLSQ